ncbi:helix-turn-helix domain-containing protein [Streptomyces sp. NPDC057250]|uniref:helix-turn-helix domain-containing protein n=1 Tax=Streptomyces sp. NPDC057250 TaxID=3346068 RepID=UPI003638587B
MDTDRPENSGTKKRLYRPRVTGDARRRLAEDLASSYRDGASLRELAGSRAMSYGTVRKLLAEVGQPRRPVGDNRLPSPY